MTASRDASLVRIEGQAGQVTEAIALHQRTLAGMEWLLGRDHPYTVTSRDNLAYSRLRADDTDKPDAGAS